ncbi:hypothetical protein ACHAXR_006452, partial [Thalassiosira sp. AJA248-18]
KLHNQGLEAIEVSDNGSGVPPSSLSTRCCSTTNTTNNSNDGDNDDANNNNNNNDSYNHGGGSSSLGEQFAFNTEGQLIPQSIQRLPRPAGTTVTVHGLFESLPVRRVDLCKRIKLQRMKLIKMMQGCKLIIIMQCLFDLWYTKLGGMCVLGIFEFAFLHAILCLGTQFNIMDVHNTKTKGKSTKSDVRLATSESSKTLEARTASVLGTKFLSGLTRIDIDLSKAVAVSQSSASSPSSAEKEEEARTTKALINDDDDDANTNNNNTNNYENVQWKLEGLISHAPTSRSSHPATARDLQFFSINGRPVDLPSVSRVLGDVWRLFDPSAEVASSSSSSSSGGRRRPACILAFTLPNNMYDVNLSPDKREVMFTEEVAMSDLLREGLMALWSGQSEGKFAANEVESRSNKSNSKSKRSKIEAMNGDDMDVTNDAKSNESKSSSKGDENEKTSAEVEKADNEIDNVTPKMRRRNTASSSIPPSAENGRLVTPRDSEVSPTDRVNASEPNPEGESNNDCGKHTVSDGVSSTSSTKNTTQPNEMEVTTLQENGIVPTHEEVEESVAPTTLNNDHKRHQQDQRGWDQMQLPERARQQQDDRRGWEQMRINFQRIEKKHLQKEMNHMLSYDNDGDEDGERNNTRHEEEMTRMCSSTKPRAATHSQRTSVVKKRSAKEASSESSTARRQSKRQKRKKDVASFLDSFSYGSTKPAAEDSNNSESSDSEQSETHEGYEHEIVDTSKRSFRNPNIRMAVGTTVTSEKRPRTSLRKFQRSNEANLPSSRASSAPSPPLEVYSDDDDCNEAEPETRTSDSAPSSPVVEAVWNSFSGTKNVIAQSQNARMMMKQNRTFLRSSVKKKRHAVDHHTDAKTGKPATSSSDENGSTATVNLCKEDFLHMSIIGQFNLGFILARCRNHNLWILDQHACDEKFNFERLCKETVIHEQKLIAPLPLELSPSEEHCVLEHTNIFEKNGFRFSYDPEKEPRHRLSLTALPHSGSGGDGKKAVQFGKDDVGALCAMLGADGTSSSEGYSAGFNAGVDGRIAGVNAVRRYAGLAGGSSSQDGTKLDNGIVGSSIVRLPKAIAMFASRACRGSIMIGTALSHKEQVNVLKRLDKTDIPWNCAHGRPTMSHIRSLTKCLLDDDDSIAANVAGPSLSVISEE